MSDGHAYEEHVCRCATMTDTWRCCRLHGGDGSDCPACRADNKTLCQAEGTNRG